MVSGNSVAPKRSRKPLHAWIGFERPSGGVEIFHRGALLSQAGVRCRFSPLFKL